ncbi:glycosyltransferase [Nguyenibacter vanlangensis]|uniref:Glycosyltransferase n=1 Tax=Nguyenibacter vanlangensis TaxID=1216886 RepID=A0A7Y7M665_9PROT|nr:glycosyltransferase [Nguyenibacter vanlangensis]NVN10178.1 glycosyltransferase [Nguyenibacter vanlangensis]
MTDLIPLEIELLDQWRPKWSIESSDMRSLAVGFHAITVRARDTERILARFDVTHDIPAGLHVLYGLDRPEGWGCWSMGPRLCLVMALDTAEEAITVEIDHRVPGELGGQVPCRISIAGAAFEPGAFQGGVLTVSGQARGSILLPIAANPELSIIIPSYNRADLLVRCLGAIARAEGMPAFEIIVVENGSTIESVAALGRLAPEIRVIHLLQPVSFSRAMNRGLDAARGQFVMLLNSDAFVEKDCISTLFAAVKARSTTVFGPAFYYPSGKLQEIGGRIAADGHSYRHENSSLQWRGKSEWESDYISAAGLMVSRDHILAAGGFNPTFRPAYYEDADLCLRLKARGMRTVVVPAARVTHIGNATSIGVFGTERLGRIGDTNRERLMSRWGAWLATRADEDLPEIADFDHEEANGNDATGPARTRLHVDGAIEDGGRTLASLICACAASGPVAVTGPDAPSRLDVSWLLRDYGFMPRQLAHAPVEAPPVSIVYTRSFPPPPPLPGRLQVLFLDTGDPTATDMETAYDTIGNACNYDVIVTSTPDPAGMEDAIREIYGIRLPDIRFLPVALDHRRMGALDRKQPMILLHGPVRDEHTMLIGRLVNAAGRLALSAPNTHLHFMLCLSGNTDNQRSLFADFSTVIDGDRIEFLRQPDPTLLRALKQRALCYVTWSDGTDGSDWRAETDEAASLGCLVLNLRSSSPAITASNPAVARPEALEMLKGFADLFGCGPVSFEDHVFSTTPLADVQRAWQTECASMPSRPGIRRSGCDERTAMVVVGMHRSGTSLMTHLLAAAGCDLPTSLMTPAADNQDGFWESPIFAALNDSILAEHDVAWDRLFSSARLKDAGADAHVDRIRRAIRSQYGNARAIVLKDPRTCLLMPAWHRALVEEGYAPRYILTARHPAEVAASLERRDHMPIGTGVLLWADYMVNALDFLRDKPVSVAAFDRIMDSPNDVMKHLWSAFAFPPETLPDDLSALVKPALRHHAEPRTPLAVAAKPVWDLYGALMDQAGQLPPVAQIAARVVARTDTLRMWLEGQQVLLGLESAEGDGT